MRGWGYAKLTQVTVLILRLIGVTMMNIYHMLSVPREDSYEESNSGC